MSKRVTDQQWKQFEREGYLALGPLLGPGDLRALQDEIDAIMLGQAEVDYSRMLMQLDSSTGSYGDLGEQSKGFKGATRNYRKIQDLEFDPVFLRYLQRPLFQDLCRRTHGSNAPIACFRAMFMNKPAEKGTMLPWHQDRWKDLDRDPALTVWTALDPATKANGCVQIIPGSHKTLINPDHSSGFLTEEQAKAHCREDQIIFLELAAGESVLLHNWTLHRSDVNRSGTSRRAFSVCYMDAATRYVDGRKADWTIVFGPGALTEDQLLVKH